MIFGTGALALATQVRFDFDPMNLRDPNSESVSTYLDLMQESEERPYTIKVLESGLDAVVALARRLDGFETVDKTVTLADFVPDEQDEKLDMIDDMSLYLASILYQPVRVDPPDGAARRLAFGILLDKLQLFDQDGPKGPIRDSALRLAGELANFSTGQLYTDKALAELDSRLVSTLNGRLEALRRSMSAGAIVLEDLPPEIRWQYVAPDGRARVEVFPAENINDAEALRRFVANVRTVAPDATGSPVLFLESGSAVVDAMQRATVIGIIAIASLLLVVLRTLRHTVLVLGPLVLAGALTVATSVVLDLPFNFANVIVLPLLIGLGAASGIHLVMRARHETSDTLLLTTSTPRAVVFSVLTTICSFGSLVVSSHRGRASMGELLTIALFFTFCCSLVVLPALMTWPSERARPVKH